MQRTQSQAGSFLHHVNGMRAIAILGILFYHLNATYCPAGYFGVDAFLVISGYFLIASLLKAEKPADLRYGSYLLKKSWRIIPSWLLVCLVFCIGSAPFMLPLDRVELCNTAGRSAFFGADFYIDHLYDYFNQNAHNNLFLHFWYLSITCQMYIILPLIVMLTLCCGTRRTTAWVLGIIGTLSLAFYLLTTTPQVPQELRHHLLRSTGMQTAYYHLLPRLWEIVAGGAILLLPAWQQRPTRRKLLETLGALGVILSFFLFETGSAQVYMAALGTMLFIRYGGGGPIARLLACKPIQWVGTISFSLYLWHWPIMAGWKYIRLGDIYWYDELGMVLLSLLMGHLAWRWVESLNMPKARTRAALTLRFLPLLLLALFAAGIRPYYKSIKAQTGEWAKGKGLVSEVLAIISTRPPDAELQRGFTTSILLPRPPAYIGTQTTATPSFLLIGDSHSTHSFLGMEHYCNEHGIRGIFWNNHVTPFWWCYKDNLSPWNPEIAETFTEYLRQHPELEYVFISTLWWDRLYASDSKNSGVTMDWREMKRMELAEQINLREAGLRETCRILTEMGRKVILLTDIPQLPSRPSPYERWLKVKMLTGEDAPEHLTPASVHKEKESRYAQLFHQLAADGLVWAVIDSAEPLRRGEAYATRDKKGEFLYYDSNHLTTAGSLIVGTYILDEWTRRKQPENSATP